MIHEIKSSSNEKIKQLHKLTQKKYRDLYKKFIIEGYKPIYEAITNNLNLDSVFILKGKEHKFQFLSNNFYLVDEKIMKKISTTESTPEAVAVMNQLDYSLDNISLYNKILVLENIKDPGNLGTIIRSAIAFNISAIILLGATVDLYNPKVIRCAVGNFSKIPIFKFNDILSLKKLLSNHIFISTVVNHKDSISIQDLKFPDKFAILMGSESLGLSENSINLSDIKITIPICSKVESLNLSIATSIILYQSSLF